MDRKPLKMLFHEYLSEEYEKSGLTTREFAKKAQVSQKTFVKLLNVQEKDDFRSDSFDCILQGMDITMTELEAKYGIYNEQ